jgi:hypothetical protein
MSKADNADEESQPDTLIIPELPGESLTIMVSKKGTQFLSMKGGWISMDGGAVMLEDMR